MKKLLQSIFFITLLFGGITYNIYGQVTQDIGATAQVRAAIEFTAGVATIDFGIIPDNASAQAVEVQPDGTSSGAIGGTPTAADFTISASNNTSLDITYGETTTLDDGSDNYNIGFNTQVLSNTSNATTGGTTQTGGSFTTSTNGSGDLYLFVGGDLDEYDVSGQSTPATLTATDGGGDIIFSVSYN